MFFFYLGLIIELKIGSYRSHLFDRRGVNKIFISPQFGPNLSLEKSINGANSPSVLPLYRSHMLNEFSQGQFSVNGPMLLYLPGNNTKLFLQGRNESNFEKDSDYSQSQLIASPTEFSQKDKSFAKNNYQSENNLVISNDDINLK